MDRQSAVNIGLGVFMMLGVLLCSWYAIHATHPDATNPMKSSQTRTIMITVGAVSGFFIIAGLVYYLSIRHTMV
jgi:hypothetical protein